ncbi:peptide deformylase [Candidatus Azambacteria bacterium]|nr:peptide deformylase [Candidatus Azambacteria bacterium]
MSILNIEKGAENKILRTRSEEVADIQSPEIQKFILNMKTTLKSTPNGVGLAAPQAGKNLRIFVASDDLGINQTVFINPEITKISENMILKGEGCLSLPEYYGKIRRADWVKAEACNENGRKFKIKATGLVAQLIQHEVDHLNGILFIDKAEKVESQKTDGK